MELSVETSLKKTSLYDKHVALGAKMVPFAGYSMPVSYSGLNEEHLAVRQSAGIFDVSHMGEFILKGKDALDLIQRVTSNDASVLVPGKAQYSCLTNEKGGIVDDLLVYRLDEITWMLVVNASNIEKDWNWIRKFNDRNVEMKDISDNTALLAVQGPKAASILQKLTKTDLSAIPYYSFVQGDFLCGCSNVIISNTGYTGAGGFELYVKNEDAARIWDAILDAGRQEGIKPAGLGARDTLRLEMGFCLYGNDISDETSPLEAGLGWITKFTKDFTNAGFLKEQKEKGVKRKLAGFVMTERGIPRHDYPIADGTGRIIGKVTSGTQSPSLQKGIGLGYVETAFSKPGTEISIIIREKPVKAVITRIPFYKNPE